MKKCPFCKADIEDNARFCLYCMKSLNDKETVTSQHKKPMWWLVVVVVLLLIAVILIPKWNNGTEEELPTETSVPTANFAPTAIQTQPITNPPITNAPTQPTTPLTMATQPKTQQPTTESTAVTTTPTVAPTMPTAAPTVATIPPTVATSVPTVASTPPTVSTSAPTVATTAPTKPKTNVVYIYREARAGDDFNANYQNPGNDIVITGIKKSAKDGVYDIPSYIDGKKVVAIVANAFSGSNAKVVYIPDTVKTIWNNAFADCELTDIYFRGNAIYAEANAFSGGVIIHCSAACNDRNFRYYKNSAVNYGATWEEWNG